MATRRPDPQDSGFPDIDFKEEDVSTRPMPLHEIPLQARIDREMTIIARYHDRIVKSIRVFWGHRDCEEYLHKLITSGGDGLGNTRVGFRNEVMSALINLLAIHQQEITGNPITRY
jgi:hypothetical protein